MNSDNIATKLRTMADRLENDNLDDLPKVAGFQMTEEVHRKHSVDADGDFVIYRDEAGDAWINFADEWVCVGMSVEAICEALQEANSQ